MGFLTLDSAQVSGELNMADLSDQIEENASGPASASGDIGSMQQHSLPDQIAADRFLKSQAAVADNPLRGLRFNKLIPPGAF